MTPLERYVDFVIRRRWLVAGAAVLVMLVTAAGLPGLTVSSSYRVLFGKDNPDLLAFDRLQDTYSASRSALIAVSPREGTVFTRATLAAIENLTEAAWQTPHSIRVDSLTNYSHSKAVEDDLSIEPLVEDAASFGEDDLDRVRTIALNQPELVGNWLPPTEARPAWSSASPCPTRRSPSGRRSPAISGTCSTRPVPPIRISTSSSPAT